ncbi:hypothetical protein BDY21DRAFT_418884 [Lineolata rhizophorae]|uniref:Aminoglycoside phosphotransferase domain-containing protein n=1 Tax=Lineolata rhizophorae TaxID=578093 RepID=A0A6A6PAL6_9PEZI|nr:hypothetical protein BDY21DRAFT_418884 [Lineolata rhizophorae]
MRLDQIQTKAVHTAVDEFLKSIEPDAVCAIASPFYDRTPRRVSGIENGSFNHCYFAVFDAEDDGNADRRVVQIPTRPRLGCLDKKARSEIATIKLYRYSLSSNNPIDSPFIVLEYIDGSLLLVKDVRNKEYNHYIFRQVARLLLQLHELTFD